MESDVSAEIPVPEKEVSVLLLISREVSASRVPCVRTNVPTRLFHEKSREITLFASSQVTPDQPPLHTVVEIPHPVFVIHPAPTVVL